MKNIAKYVYEAFTEDSDPIKDMSIGDMYKTTIMYAYIGKTSSDIIDEIEQKPANEFLNKKGIEYTILKKYNTGIWSIEFRGHKNALYELLDKYFKINRNQMTAFVKKCIIQPNEYIK